MEAVRDGNLLTSITRLFSRVPRADPPAVGTPLRLAFTTAAAAVAGIGHRRPVADSAPRLVYTVLAQAGIERRLAVVDTPALRLVDTAAAGAVDIAAAVADTAVVVAVEAAEDITLVVAADKVVVVAAVTEEAADTNTEGAEGSRWTNLSPTAFFVCRLFSVAG